MPTFRIVYIDDDTFSPRTLTAAFAHRAAAEIAMAKHGHRVVHIAEMKAAESPTDRVVVPMAGDGAADGAGGGKGTEARERATATQPLLGLPRYDLASVAVIAAGLAVAGAAFLLF